MPVIFCPFACRQGKFDEITTEAPRNIWDLTIHRLLGEFLSFFVKKDPDLSVSRSKESKMTENEEQLITWTQLSDRFKAVRGRGVGYHTIQGWQALGMPHLRQGRGIWYQWSDCWEWYIDQFSVRQAG